MNPIVEVNADVSLYLPTKILEAIKPNTRFVVEVSHQTLILHPANKSQPFWATATPEERAESISCNSHLLNRQSLGEWTH